MNKYFTDESSVHPEFSTYFVGKLVTPSSPEMVLSAYGPGPHQGGTEDGNVIHPWSKASTDYRRNFYSTKLISLDSISGDTGKAGYGVTNFTLYSEGETHLPAGLPAAFSSIRNPLSNQVPDSILH